MRNSRKRPLAIYLVSFGIFFLCAITGAYSYWHIFSEIPEPKALNVANANVTLRTEEIPALASLFIPPEKTVIEAEKNPVNIHYMLQGISFSDSVDKSLAMIRQQGQTRNFQVGDIITVNPLTTVVRIESDAVLLTRSQGDIRLVLESKKPIFPASIAAKKKALAPLYDVYKLTFHNSHIEGKYWTVRPYILTIMTTRLWLRDTDKILSIDDVKPDDENAIERAENIWKSLSKVTVSFIRDEKVMTSIIDIEN